MAQMMAGLMALEMAGELFDTFMPQPSESILAPLGLDFDPETWIEESHNIDFLEQPIRRLARYIVDILSIFAPFTKYLKTLVDIFVEMVFMNNFYTEMFIMLIPTLPLIYLIDYFLTTV